MKISYAFHLIHTDILKYAKVNNVKPTFVRKLSIILLPCVSAIAIYRISHYFFSNGHPLLARLFWTLNIILFSVDIIPYSEIGPYFYMPHPTGIVLMAKLGENVTVYAQAGIGGGRKNEDIGAGKGSPIIGNNVVVGACSKVMGSVKVGDNVTIGPASVVFKDVSDGLVVFGIPARVVKKQQAPSEHIVDDDLIERLKATENGAN